MSYYCDIAVVGNGQSFYETGVSKEGFGRLSIGQLKKSYKPRKKVTNSNINKEITPFNIIFLHNDSVDHLIETLIKLKENMTKVSNQKEVSE